MITKEQAQALRLGDVLRHTSLRNREGQLLEAKVVAACHTAHDAPQYWSVSVVCAKLHRSFEVTNLTARNWEVLR